MNDAQIKRITKYEEIYDEVSSAVAELNAAMERFSGMGGKITALEKYYTGRLWRKDFADDEAGLLPPDLKRGVLSEDGVYNLLEEIKELM